LIFVSVGANPHPFDRLIKEVDRLVSEKKIKDEFIVQLGNTNYYSKNIKKVKKFWKENEYKKILRSCNLIITHAGLGNVMVGMEHNKPLIVVPRRKEFGEHVDNHQMEMAKYIEKSESCLVIHDINDLESSIKKMVKIKIKLKKRVEPEILNIIKNLVKSILE